MHFRIPNQHNLFTSKNRQKPTDTKKSVMEKCGFVDTGMLNKCSQLVGGDKDMVKVFKYKGLKNEKEIKSNG